MHDCFVFVVLLTPLVFFFLRPLIIPVSPILLLSASVILLSSTRKIIATQIIWTVLPVVFPVVLSTWIGNLWIVLSSDFLVLAFVHSVILNPLVLVFA